MKSKKDTVDDPIGFSESARVVLYVAVAASLAWALTSKDSSRLYTCVLTQTIRIHAHAPHVYTRTYTHARIHTHVYTRTYTRTRTARIHTHITYTPSHHRKSDQRPFGDS